MRRFDFCFFVLLLLTASLVLSCCSSTLGQQDSPRPDQKHTVELSFNFNGEWEVSDQQLIEEFGQYIENYLSYGIERHKISIYKADNVSSAATPVLSYDLERVISGVGYDFTLPVTLPAGSYIVKIWTDFYEIESAKPYYDNSGFPAVLLSRHSGLTCYQDAFSGSQSITVDENTSPVKVAMNRPVGRYLLSSSDFSELLKESGNSIEDVNVVVAYSGFYPDTYSVMTDRLTDSITGEYYVIKPQVASEGNAIVGSDFMLMNAGSSSVTLQIGLTDSEGKLIASSENMSIPMNRNQVTLISGKLLSKASGDGGGFDLDTGFDGDFIIKP